MGQGRTEAVLDGRAAVQCGQRLMDDDRLGLFRTKPDKAHNPVAGIEVAGVEAEQVFDQALDVHRPRFFGHQSAGAQVIDGDFLQLVFREKRALEKRAGGLRDKFQVGCWPFSR